MAQDIEKLTNGLYKKNANGVYTNVFDGTTYSGPGYTDGVKTISDSNPAADSIWPNIDESILGNDYKDYVNSELDGSIFDPDDPRNKNSLSFEDSMEAGKYLNEKYGDEWWKREKKESKKSKKSKKQGGILRYPMESLTHHTDYLQIDIVEYKPVGNDVKTEAYTKKIPIKQMYDDDGSKIDHDLVRKEQALRVVKGSKFIGNHGNRRGTNLNSRAGGMRSYGLANRPLINTGTIILPIPANIQDTNSVDYSDSKLDGLQGAAAASVYDLMNTDVSKTNIASAAGTAATNFQGELAAGGVTPTKAKDLALTKLTSAALGIFGGNVTANQLYARARGEVINPNMEVLFNGPKLRAFKFSFKMTPRNEREARQCKLIIRAFKRNMAPKAEQDNKFFLKTPNIFELRYRTGLSNHPFLHKFKQCFLTDVNVNYTADGVYSTYDDATPVSMILDLSFKELEPIFDTDYDAEQGLEGVGY